MRKNPDLADTQEVEPSVHCYGNPVDLAYSTPDFLFWKHYMCMFDPVLVLPYLKPTVPAQLP